MSIYLYWLLSKIICEGHNNEEEQILTQRSWFLLLNKRNSKLSVFAIVYIEFRNNQSAFWKQFQI